MKNKITAITAEEILDSRGNPTLLVSVAADSALGQFAVPAGASTGIHEANEKRDGDPARFRGLGVASAVESVRQKIAPALRGLDVADQKTIDRIMLELDGTANKSNLGGNAIIGVSIACAKAAAKSAGLEPFNYLRTLADIKPSQTVPYLYMNLINGGKHAQSKLAFQEYHAVPLTDDVREALNIGTAIQHHLKKLIREEFGPVSANLGDEGGFVPDVVSVVKPLELLVEVIEKNNFSGKVKLAMDVAASSFYEEGNYLVAGERVSAEELTQQYRAMIKRFPILSIEDPFFEEDFANFQKINDGGPLIIGDDLTVTNASRLRMALEQKSIGGIIIKPNQVGTLTETLETMKLAREHGLACIVSHRSGETNDDFIADLAYAFGAFGLKAGAPQRGERVAKYNRLMQITRLPAQADAL